MALPEVQEGRGAPRAWPLRAAGGLILLALAVEYGLRARGGDGWPGGHPWSAIALALLGAQLFLLKPSRPAWILMVLSLLAVAAWVIANHVG